MGLDIRWPIGFMFALIGVLLVITGLTDEGRSLGININLRWGFVLLIFGAFMLILAWRGSKQTPSGPSGGGSPNP